MPNLNLAVSRIAALCKPLCPLLPLLALAACGDDQLSGVPPPGQLPPSEPPLLAGCNPLGGGAGEDCLTPFPFSYYSKTDDKGHLQVQLTAAVLPSSHDGIALDPAPWNRRDGYSPATPLIAYFPTPIDPLSLPGPQRIADTLLPASAVQLLRYDTGERVPVFAEVDANASDGERQALIIYPQVRLRPQTRYVVALRNLRGRHGEARPPLAGFAALRDDQLVAGSVRAALRPRFVEIFVLLEQSGVPRSGLQLAWDFTTASDDGASGRMVRLRDQALRYQPMGMTPVTISEWHEMPNDNLLRQGIGTFTAPSFLTDDTNGRLLYGGDGEPKIRGPGQFPLVIHVPLCVTTQMAPVPVMIYGHGLFGGALGEMQSSYQRDIINRLCMVQIGTDWLGLAAADQLYVLKNVLNNFNNFAQLTERLQQAHVNVAVLAHLVKSGALDKLPQLTVNGRPILDSKRLYYYGISDGGIQGLTALALSADFNRGCLNVPGGFWSQMMWRSGDFKDLAALMQVAYPDPLDRQLLVALTQTLWDYTDPATYAPHLLRDPLPGSSAKKILYQEGIGDGQVPNLATRAMVRTMGISLLNQPVEPVFGVSQIDAPTDSAYVQFDVGQMPRPGDNNVPPADNPVYEAIRRLEAAKQQLQAFLREDGKVVDPCGAKPCRFPKP